ncbi:MAG: hypothetical protein KJ900_13175 [Proteobacteria bacterium]|nr:hypothetical protein [Desulfocapsa sp.]MBU3943469.1 hypothetical protein [Pseudomonadota bacterium]MCG2745498.1 hypothetical protein [Desulfobacteraceae bacterium]MBU4028958.1 hypothetical protein [Pseudomonadota bacterium]MBU4043830.1 hypothetical protein [Pseudomonadota bacterium]
MRGIFLEAELLNSVAFRSLSRWGLRVYMGFLSRRVIVKKKDKGRGDAHVIANNGQIVYCYSTAENDGIPRREFRNAIDELIALGFIDINHQGAGGRSRDMTTYSIVERWKKWNTPDYQPTPTPRIRNTKEGQGWQVYNTRQQKKSVTNMSPENPLSSDKIDTPKQKNRIIGVTKMTPEKMHEKAISA